MVMESESVEFYIKLATGLVLVIILATWSFFFGGKRARLPPGPFLLSIIGNIPQLGERPHRVLEALSRKYGPVMSVRLGSALVLVVSSGNMAKEFLKTYDLRFASRAPTTAAQYLSYNYSYIALAPYGPSWRHLRKVCVLQLLSSRRIESFRFIREEEVSAMIRSVINLDRPLNITKTVSALATDIICRMVFGRKFSAQDLTGSIGITSLIMESSLLCGSFNIGDYIPCLAWMDLQRLNRRLKDMHKKQDDLLEKLLEEHLSQNKHNVVPDIVDVLFETSADKHLEFEITRDNIKAVIYDMLLAGTDTVSTTIEWTMSELLRKPPVLKKLQNELEGVAQLSHCFDWRLPDDMDGQELDMTEKFGLTLRRAHELLAVPTPRLPVL